MELASDFAVIGGIIISLVFIVLLTKSRNRGLHKSILMIIFCLMFFTSVHAYASIHELNTLRYISFLFDYSLLWILGPLLLLYIKSLFFDTETLLRRNLFHFIPGFLLAFAVFFPKLMTQIFSELSFEYLDLYQNNQLIFLLIRNSYFVIYLFLSITLFLDLKRNVPKNLNFSIEEYNWIHKLLLGSLMFVSVDVLIRSFEFFISELPFDGGYITLFAMIAFMCYLGYHGLNETKVVIPAFLLQKNENIDIRFTREETKLLQQNLKHSLEIKKLYLDESLSLKKLSESLQLSDKRLSAFLNNHLNTSFKDYINSYRVAEVKDKLKSGAYHKYTLEAISNECGFNSKASFYRIFKKHTGLSPSEYKKSHLN